ncbi:MAG TPA: hypothetical protein VHS33_11315 [Sphingomicrobium sp.]|nr:hypothetical protein [Sphingomicrobium sp.]
MLRKLRASLIWLQMRRKYRDGDLGGALLLAARLRELGVTSPMLDAKEATLLTLTRRFDEANRMFREIASRTAQSSEPDLQYVHEYCRYQLEIAAGDRDKAEKQRLVAKNVVASKLVTSELPILNESLPSEWFD